MLQFVLLGHGLETVFVNLFEVPDLTGSLTIVVEGYNPIYTNN